MGERNAIWLQFRQTKRYWAAEFYLINVSLPGIGSRADTAMNSSHIANAFTLCAILKTTSKMKLNIKDIQPLEGQMSCNLWENSHINLPLTLYYSIEIPLLPFNSGHNYVNQPTNTTIIIEWAIFSDGQNENQERNWKNLVGRHFNLSYDDETAEGSIYLGTEHCQFNSYIKFLALNGTTFDIELKMAVNFNIETSNLDADGCVKIKTQVDYDGLRIYHTQLPTFQKADDQLALIGKFIDLTVYQNDLTRFDNANVDWKHLKPRQ